MALHIHRAESAGTLAEQLAVMLARPLPDPFTADVVAVGAPGVQRWLHQRLACRLGADAGAGVAANIRYPTPAALVAEISAAACGIAADADPWSLDRLLWPVLAAVDESVTQPWAAALARHVGAGQISGDGSRSGRRVATATHIAALFDRYGATRPSVITEWAAGADTDGCGGDLPEELRWQPRLWRRVRADIGVPAPAERLAAVCQRLRAEPSGIDLPQRISVFGPARIVAGQLTVLGALAEHRDVH
ncbi:MAG: exodeoxyribonuclease V subunit gamma, partial [Nocardia sp.]|nr:exodeoxyribonuclease V subunit gamma [Nocardia sp.]